MLQLKHKLFRAYADTAKQLFGVALQVLNKMQEMFPQGPPKQ